MIYFVSLLIVLLFSFLELSFLPYFTVFNINIFMVLAYLVALSVKSRNYFHIALALIAGIIFDFASSGFMGQFTLTFVLTVLIGRLFFYRKTSYKSANSFLILLIVSTLVVYLFQIPILFDNNFYGWQNYLLSVLLGTIGTVIFGLIMYRLLEPYFNWIEEKTEK
ncbi:MAG: hypothetical protein WC437_00385 [Patescibacteria group bacterium]|nr:hypothetical protein [Patescibacteria group bacterium]